MHQKRKIDTQLFHTDKISLIFAYHFSLYYY